MDEALRRYQQDIARAQISRRRFMTIAALGWDERGPRRLRRKQRHGGAVGGRVVGGLGRAVGRARGVRKRSAERCGGGLVPARRDATSTCSTGRTTSPTTTRRRSRRSSTRAITYDTYPSNEELLAKLQAGGKGQYDIAVPTAEFSTTLADGGYLAKLDKSRLPNLTKVNRRFLTLPFDPNDDYIVPKDWGTTGIIYRGSREGAGDVVEGLLRPRQGQVLGQDAHRQLAR